MGRPKQPGLMLGMDQKDTYVGDEVNSKHQHLNLSYPIDYGMINHWENMEKIWHHIYNNELHVISEDHPVLMTEQPNTVKKDREKMMEIVFEKLMAPAFYLSI